MKKCVSFLLVFLAAFCLFADAPVVVFSVSPQILFPLAPEDDEGDVLYGMGGGGALGAAVSPRSMRWFSGVLEMGFDYLTTTVTEDSLSLIRFGGGVGFGLHGPKFGVRLTGTGGYYYGFYGSSGGGNLYYDGGLTLSYRVNEAFTLSLLGGWRDYLSTGDSSDTHLLRTPYAGLSLALEPAAFRAKGLLTIDDLRVRPLFPTLMKYYASNPLGTVTFTNKEAFEITDVEVSFFVPAYMDGPTVVARYPAVKRNETMTIDLAGVFNPKILSVTEGTIAQAEVHIEYKLSDRSTKATKSGDVTIYDRGAMSWDDDRKAAVFITTKDQALLTFAKNTYAHTEAVKGLAGDRAMRAALGLFESLRLYGIQYAPDPSSPYGSALDGSSIDFLQFPAQTLQFKSGDCDDLTILYCTLLESIGIETAMITTPGHIFPALALDMSPSSVKTFFGNPEDYIVQDDMVWIPVEVTLVKKGFSNAWRQAAREYHAARAKGEAGFFRVRTSWEQYEPVGFIEESRTPVVPEKSVLERSVKQEYSRLVDLLLAANEPILVKAVEKAKAGTDRAKAQNQLGVFYARLGLDDKALAEFEKAKTQGYSSAEINIGNLHVRNERFREAVRVFGAVVSREPDNAGALYGLVQAAAMAGDQKLAEESLKKLEVINPELAGRASGVVKSATARESYAGSQGSLWQED